MKTSNSSRHLKGESTESQRARIKQTVEKDLSPPDRAFKSFAPPAVADADDSDGSTFSNKKTAYIFRFPQKGFNVQLNHNQDLDIRNTC